MDFTLFRNRNFTLVIIGRFVSLLGTIFQEFALSLYVLNRTGSGTKFASVLAIALIPKLIIGPFAGVLADWFDRKKMVVLLDTMSGLIVAGFAVLYIINGELTLLQIYILVLALSVISVLFGPAAGAMIPQIIKKDRLGDANSVSSFVTSLTSIIAPLLAGLVFGLVGLLAILIVNAISFLLSAISESFIQLPLDEEHKEKNVIRFFKDFGEGIGVIKGNRDMMILLIIGALINFAISPMFAVCVPYVLKQKLLITNYQYGVFQALVCIGPLVASLVAGKLMKKRPFYHINTMAFVFAGVLVLMIGIVCHPSFMLLDGGKFISFVALIILSFGIVSAIVICNIAVGTAMQTKVDVKVLGRVIAVFSTLMMASTPLGQMIMGHLLDTSLDTYIIILCVGLILITGGLINYILYLPKKEVASLE